MSAAAPGLPRRLIGHTSRVFAGLGWALLMALVVGAVFRTACALPPSPPSGAFGGLVFAHRGQAGDAPENTLSAMRAAVAAGATGLEVDVRLTADGHAVLMHDATLERTTDGTGPVGGVTLDALRRLDASGGRAAYAGEAVPTLDEAVALAMELQVKLELDAKDVDAGVLAEQVAVVLERHAAFGQVFVSSFYPQVLHAVRSREPRVVTGLAIRADATGVAIVDRVLLSDWLPKWLGVGVVEPHRDLVSREAVERWRRQGFVVNAWTVNGAADKAWCRAVGVSFTTNCPGQICADEASDQM